jgi:phospholipase/lecithinase/hemolysin
MKSFSRFSFLAICLFGLSSSVFAAYPKFDEMIGFGDSLTDVGNSALLTIPGQSPRINGYLKMNHFSDGILWNQRVARELKLGKRTLGRGKTTSLKPRRHGNTWAWGGSEAATGSVQPSSVTEPIPNLLTEIANYLATNKPTKRTLYSIWAGADNLLIGHQFTPEAAQAAAQAVLTGIEEIILKGGLNYLIFNNPALGDTPAAQALGPTFIALANGYSIAFNTALNEGLKAFKQKYKKIRIFYVDIYSELNKAVAFVGEGGTYQPAFFCPGPKVAITNVTLEGLAYFNKFGKFPPNYLFWDDVHPTREGHQVIAGLVLRALRKE